jgi:DNA-binding HxlR family transcriptional regulator
MVNINLNGYDVCMRSYGQYCSVARALDVVGDRWALLIVRELLVQGPCRFTDLKNGLPGIAPNLLSGRLKDLDEAGIVSREDAPPPIATVLYSLTPSGRDLEPVLKTLGAWGLRQMSTEHPNDAFQAQWLAYAAAWFTTDADPAAGPAVLQLVAPASPPTGGALAEAIVELDGHGNIDARVGRAAHPDLVVQGPPRLVLGLITGMLDRDHAVAAGVRINGEPDLLSRLRPTVTSGNHPD